MPTHRAVASLRTWQDATGDYTTEGRLLWVRDSQVRILKTNGMTTTVRLNRLSEVDRQYIDHFLAANKTLEKPAAREAS